MRLGYLKGADFVLDRGEGFDFSAFIMNTWKWRVSFERGCRYSCYAELLFFCWWSIVFSPGVLGFSFRDSFYIVGFSFSLRKNVA